MHYPFITRPNSPLEALLSEAQKAPCTVSRLKSANHVGGAPLTLYFSVIVAIPLIPSSLFCEYGLICQVSITLVL